MTSSSTYQKSGRRFDGYLLYNTTSLFRWLEDLDLRGRFRFREDVLRWEPCVYCGKCDQRATIDHIVPKKVGGFDYLDNNAPSCYSCNLKKGVTPMLLFVVQRGGLKWDARPVRRCDR